MSPTRQGFTFVAASSTGAEEWGVDHCVCPRALDSLSETYILSLKCAKRRASENLGPYWMGCRTTQHTEQNSLHNG